MNIDLQGILHGICMFKEQRKERLVEEHSEITKQTKDYWELQTRYFSRISLLII
ncbi:hypothetical protein Hanom_Chr17g01538961 [Helianthus anomalus]